MTPFLKSVAEDLYAKTGGDLSRTVVVFPNKRAGLFFNKWLTTCTEKPLWSPVYMTISELFRELTDLQVADPIRLVCTLYDIFCQETGNDKETLDNFYFWGEMLVADFDDLDKNMVDADQLFQNLKDLRQMMDDHSYLTEEQEKALRTFFQNFSIDKKTELKENFLNLWNSLGNIYHRFRDTLMAEGMSYEGMLYRTAIEQADFARLPYERYVFVGFNVLNRVEHRLFTLLQAQKRALFYWDYDLHYVNHPGHEAGEFIRRNLRDFPNELTDEALFTNLQLPKEIEYIAASTENEQARYAPQWLREHLTERENETAIVLCNEGILQPVLHALPEKQIKALNITMGYPLNGTPIHNLMTLLTELYTDGYDPRSGRYLHRYVSAVLKHPYVRLLSPQAEPLNYALTEKNRFFPLPSELQVDELLTQLFPSEGATTGNRLCERLLEIINRTASLFRTDAPDGESTDALNEESLNDPDKEPSDNKDKGLSANNSEGSLYNKGEESSDNHSEESSESNGEGTLYNKGEAPSEAPTTTQDQLSQEAIFKCHTLVSRLNRLIEEGTLEVNQETLTRLLKNLLSAQSIPFHGEPAIGLQVMGVLETRNLDFRHILMLSVNEGKLPKQEADSSFIPYNLRKAFGMTTVEHKNAVYAYYFYRLIQRAERVTMLYNTSSEGLNRGEMSRFMLQHLIEKHPSNHITRYRLSARQSVLHTSAIEVEADEEIIARLKRRFGGTDGYLSPSALNVYLDCPFKFYLRYACQLREADEVTTDINSSVFGNIFHRATEIIYKEVLGTHGGRITREAIQALLADGGIQVGEIVNRAFKEIFFQIPLDQRAEYDGLQLLNKEVITAYVRQLLRRDADHAPFRFVAAEYPVRQTVTVKPADGTPSFDITLGGSIDRMDEKGDSLRIIDYKTGSRIQEARDVEQMFDSTDKHRPYHLFQTFFYASLLSAQTQRCITPALFYIQKAASEEYSPTVKVGKILVEDYAPYHSEYTGKLHQLLGEVFATGNRFGQTTVTHRCEFCEFAHICSR